MTRLFTIHDVDEETPVQYVGVYTMNWRPEWGAPTVMFAPMDDPVYDAAHELLEACKQAYDLATLGIRQFTAKYGDDYKSCDVTVMLESIIAKVAMECNECGGTGTVIVTSSPGLPEHGTIEQESCPKCNGEGTG